MKINTRCIISEIFVSFFRFSNRLLLNNDHCTAVSPEHGTQTNTKASCLLDLKLVIFYITYDLLIKLVSFI